MPQVTFTGYMTFPWALLSAPVTYPAPTLAAMLDSLALDLRDPENKAFTEDTLTEYVRLAFIEVGRVCPKEATETIQMVEDRWAFDLTIEDPWRVQIIDPDGVATEVKPGYGDSPDGGWETYAGILYIPGSTRFTAYVDDTTGDRLKVWGYLPRNPPTDPEELCDVDGPTEAAIRLHAKLQAYESLASDRALFSQWSAAPGNTDVSMSQVLGLVEVHSRMWEQKRRQMRTIRRQP